MFFGIIMTVWTVLHVYVLWRAASVHIIARHVRPLVMIAAGGLLWASLFISRLLEAVGATRIGGVLEAVSVNWIGALFLMFAALLAVDIVTLFGVLWPSMAPTLRGWALIAGGVLCVIALVQASRAPVVTAYEVQLTGLPQECDGTVLVVASDLHLGTLVSSRWTSARVDQIQAQHPDMVVLAGDIIEGHGENHDALSQLGRLSAPLGLWAVNGNHERYGRASNGTRLKGLEDVGFHVLRDQWAEARPGLIIAGVDDLTSRRRSGSSGDFVGRALAGRPAGATVFVSHTPWFADQAARAGAGLMLSGHTHNGQIWPFTYVVRAIYPLVAGRYTVDGMPVIVCRGTGTWGPRMRLWQRGEILRITLRAPRAIASGRQP